MAKDVLITAIIVHYKNWKDTTECIDSLRKQTFSKRDLKIMVVDTGKDLIPKIPKFVEYTKIGRNIGCAGALDWGITHSNSKYLLLLNNDVVLHRRCVELLAQSARKHPRAGGVGPCIKNFNQVNTVQKLYASIDEKTLDMVNHKEGNGGWVEATVGCVTLIRRKVFEEVGLWDEQYFHFFEDTDFFLRTKQSGVRFWCEPDAVAWHKGGQSLGPSSDDHIYYMIRNRLVYLKKFGRLDWKEHIKTVRFMFTGGHSAIREGIWDYYIGKRGQR